MENIKLSIIDNVIWSCFIGGNVYLGIYLTKLKKENEEKQVKISYEKKNN